MPPRPPLTKSQRRIQSAKRDEQAVRQKAVNAQQHAVFNRKDPLKQYVRQYGWLEITKGYVERLRAAGVVRPWKYLTFPGEFASDIGLFWNAGLIERSEEGVLNVAICDQEYAEQVVARLAVIGSMLSYSSRPLHDELRTRGSQLVAQFPFDVINLDLCNALITPTSTQNLITIDWIFRLQRGQSFLLLLTSRVGDVVDPSLLEVLNANLEEEERFRNAYRDKFGGIAPGLCTADHTVFTQITFPKAIARWAQHWGYETTETFVARYPRNQYDMICHSLEFRPLGVRVDSSKYEPRPRIRPVMDNAPIRDRLHQNLSTTVQNEATAAYADFIEYLVRRSPINISRVFQGNPRQKAELTAQAELIDQYRWLPPVAI